MKKYLKSFWFCFFGFILLFTIYDYIKHLMYDDSTFRDHALDWFLFSSISILTLSGIIYASYLIIQKLIKPRNFAFDGVGVALAFVVHIKITGPLYNQLFWPHDTLYFFFRWVPFLIIIGMFYLIRIAFYLFIERRSMNK